MDDFEKAAFALEFLVKDFCCEVQGCGMLYTATGAARRLWRHSHGHSQAAVLER